MSTLNLALRLLAFDDAVLSSNPQKRTVDRNYLLEGLSTGRPLSYPLTLAPGAVATVFDGARTLSADGTTQLQLVLSPLSPSRYRLKWTGSGTNPAFKTERAFAASGFTLTLTLNADQTLVVSGAGPAYGTVQVGDQVLIPGVATGDVAGPFDPLNVGYWSAIGVSGSSMTLARTGGWSGGLGGAVAITSNDQIVVFAPDRVQVGDTLEILGAFSTASRRTFPVVAVSPRWVDILSTVPVAGEVVTLGSPANLAAYAAARQMVVLEADQLLGVAVNGVSGLKLDPMTWSDGSRLGLLILTGPVWKLEVTNLTTQDATGLAIAFPV
jgi:hypothetical protein